MDMGKTKFDVGQRVWAIHTRIKTEHDVCERCKGKPKQIVTWPDGHKTEVLCESCRYHTRPGIGYKVRLTTKTDVLWLSGIICAVEVSMPSRWNMGERDKKPREVIYHLRDQQWLDPQDTYHRDFIQHEERLFGSLEEAQAYVDQRQVIVEEAA